MLTERQSQILNAIVDEYIHAAVPVSSGMIFDRGIFDVSCPTIRNEMADLTGMGYLAQPHTSAGRVPTEKGYRLFVDILISEGSAAGSVKRDSTNKKSSISGEKIMDKARRVSRDTNDLVIFVDEEDGEVKYFGLRKVFENPEFKTHAAVVSMLGELERFENYVEAVEKYLARDLEIFIGSENPFFENTEYSMISARINNNIIAVLGPMRMDYKINLSLLERI